MSATPTTCTSAIDSAREAAQAACDAHDAASIAYSNAVRGSDSLTVWAKHVAEVKRTERTYHAALKRYQQAEHIGACDAIH